MTYHRAEGDVALVLLGVGGAPAAEGREVREGRVVVVVSVPEGQLRAIAVGGGAEDSLPLVVRGVHTAADAVGSARVLQLLVERLVGAVVALPVLRTFNIQPNSTRPLGLAVVVEVVDQLGHLSGGALGAGRA